MINLNNSKYKFIVYAVLFISLFFVCTFYAYIAPNLFTNVVSNNPNSYTSHEGHYYTNLSPDGYYYVYIVENIRGYNDGAELSAPYTHRIVPLLLAAITPMPPMEAISFWSVVFLYIGLIYLICTLKLLSYNEKNVLIGAILYVFSFPVFYYGVGQALVDSIAAGYSFIITYYILKRRYITLIPLFAIMAGVKDILIPFVAIAVVFIYFDSKDIKKTAVLTVIYFATYYLAKYYITGIFDNKADYSVIIKWEIFTANLVRSRFYFSSIFSFGIVGLFSVLYLFKKYKTVLKDPVIATMTFGFLVHIAVFIYSVISAYSAGRYLWGMYPFTIVLSLEYLKYRKSNKLNKTS